MVMLSAQIKNNNTLIAKRNYTFDAVGRVSARTQTRGTDTARNDSFGYNDRSELTSAVLGSDEFAYSFDNIGNRITAEELSDEISYTANNLNQYTAIAKNEDPAFVPTFDDDGNQLAVQTTTGVWNVTYNAENRPITFTQGTTVIECKYDSQGRRFEKKVIANNAVTFWQRYAYKGYLQIAVFNVLSVNETEVLSLATTTYWDATEPTATRPLAFTDHTVATPTTYFYTHDLTKNVCEILSRNGTAVSIATTYDYTPFGAVTSSNSSTPNTFTFSSEVLDPETALVYYNYRHYNPADGRWLSRDPIKERGGMNIYFALKNNSITFFDISGLNCCRGKKIPEGMGCCNTEDGERLYATQLYCCKGNNIYSKQKKSTGVSINEGYIKGDLLWGQVSAHTYVQIDKIGFGLYAASHVNRGGSSSGSSDSSSGSGNSSAAIYDDGVIQTNDLTVYPVMTSPASGDAYAIQHPVNLSPCEYDIDKFRNCVSSYILLLQTNPGYMILGWNCSTFAHTVINNCMESSKRK